LIPFDREDQLFFLFGGVVCWGENGFTSLPAPFMSFLGGWIDNVGRVAVDAHSAIGGAVDSVGGSLNVASSAASKAAGEAHSAIGGAVDSVGGTLNGASSAASSSLSAASKAAQSAASSASDQFTRRNTGQEINVGDSSSVVHSWTCQDCGIEGYGGTNDNTKCADASGKWSFYWGCCNCAKDKHSWTGQGCGHCNERSELSSKPSATQAQKASQGSPARVGLPGSGVVRKAMNLGGYAANSVSTGVSAVSTSAAEKLENISLSDIDPWSLVHTHTHTLTYTHSHTHTHTHAPLR